MLLFFFLAQLHRHYELKKHLQQRLHSITFVSFASVPNVGNIVSGFVQAMHLHIICGSQMLPLSRDLRRLCNTLHSCIQYKEMIVKEPSLLLVFQCSQRVLKVQMKTEVELIWQQLTGLSCSIKFSDFGVQNPPRRIWSMSRQMPRISNIFQ